MEDENKKSKHFIIKKIFLVAVLEIVIFYFAMLFVYGIVQIISEIVNVSDTIYNSIMNISSIIIGSISCLIIMKKLFKDDEKDLLKVTIGMILIQILVFILLFVSAQDVINKTVISLKEEESLKDVFYDEYAIKAILRGFNYEEWKSEYIKMLDTSKKVWNDYSFITISLYSTSNFVGIIIASIMLKNKQKRNACQTNL